MLNHQSVKRFVADLWLKHRWVCADNGRMKKVSVRHIHCIKKAAAKMPLQSSKKLFETVGVPEDS